MAGNAAASNGRELTINVADYVERRAAQISDLLALVDNSRLVAGEVTRGPRTAAQRLPRHMRRRAMSHNVKRMPHRLRSFAAPFIISKHRKKPPSRFARRRPRNLLLNYVRRQRAQTWLETHLWHAKRFHIVNKWGYRVPDRSFQRNFRPIYRSSRRQCIIRDKSYLTCFLLSAPSQSILLNRLRPLCPPPTVCSTFAARSGLDGTLELTTLIYQPGLYPRGFIAPARFCWSIEEKSGRSQLSLWTHPASRQRVLEVLNETCGLRLKRADSGEDEEHRKQVEEPTSISEWRAARQRILTDEYGGDEDIQLADLRDQLVRFRLVGPRSLHVLADALRLVKEKGAEGEGEDDHEMATLFRDHHSNWSSVYGTHTPGDIVDGTVLSLLIEDPRCGRPPHRPTVAPPKRPLSARSPDDIPRLPPLPLFWSRQARIEALEARVSGAEWTKRRGTQLAPILSTEAKIPILIVMRNSSYDAPTLSGADVIVPAGFGLDLWVALQLRAVRASGLRDEQAAHIEANRPIFPFDAADADVGREEEKEEERLREEKHCRRPWNRRPSYWKHLSVLHPHSFAWPQLAAEWSSTKDAVIPPVFIVRDRRTLMELDGWLKGRGRDAPQGILNEPGALVPVSLRCTGRGRPKRFALICLPRPADLAAIRQRKAVEIIQPKRGEEGEESSEEEEEVDGDAANGLSKGERVSEMWRDYVDLDASSREKNISLTDLFPSNTTSSVEKRHLLNRKKKIRAKRRKVEAAKRAASAEREHKEHSAISYRESSNRTVIGRVVRGDFCFSAARGRCVAFVPAAALSQLRPATKGEGYGRQTVLFRNVTSKYYHPASIRVITASAAIL